MNIWKQRLESQSTITLLVAVAVMLIALLLPSKIALLGTALFFLIFSILQPQQSILFLVIYINIRPFLLEVNSGVKLIGDLITFVVFAWTLFHYRHNIHALFTFKWFEWAYFAFILFGSVIGLMQDVTITAVIFQIRTFVIMYLLYYVISRMALTDKWLQQLAWVTVWVNIVMSLHGLVEKLSLRQLLLPEEWKYKVLSATNAVRIYGLAGNPNSLALSLFFGIIGIIYLQHVYQHNKYKWTFRVLLVLFFGILILTYSRGTWISAVTFGTVFILMTRKWYLLKRLAVAGIASIILIYYPINLAVQFIQELGVEIEQKPHSAGSIGGRFGETFDEKNLALMTESGRFYYIRKGFEIFGDHPITGTGFGSFGGSATLSYGSPIYAHYGISSDIYGGKYFYSDNQYIQVIAETGVVGVLIFAVFLLSMLWLFWKSRHTNFGVFMIALWFSTGISGMYYNIWELKMYTLFYFILLGAFVALGKHQPPSSKTANG
ncbi:polymerase [Sporosarcina sp. P37]|uniref:O-antigen ligase family protein n=1 Tax=unclassified Sporosarcina TaxID=2647733 RepID=UPI000A17CA61|nr:MULTISPECIES: O-antigen ligase family protein [unclassified Sporosarcina]ARK25460.1 polymerase [Sporosarcina sp. P37]PID18986.1 polymerase [Sporosarcina sp. P35]